MDDGGPSQTGADGMTAHRIDDLARRGPLGRSKLYGEIAAGRLVARKVGRATIVLEVDWRRFLASAPIVKPRTSAGS